MPTWPVHLAIANKLVKKYHYTEDFIIGNVLPDTMNGFMVPNTSNIYHHTITHYSKVSPLGPPKINIIDFLNDNRKKLDNELILGTYTHLLADSFFNEYTMKHHIKEENKTLYAMLNDGSIERNKPPMPIKQQDFKVFGDVFIKNKEIGNSINITKETINLSKDLNYQIEKEDILKTVDKINEIVNQKEIEQAKYQMFTYKELVDLYNNCYENIEKAINDISKEKELAHAFEDYISKYDMEDSDINYKYYHSYRVMNHAKYLAEKLNLSKEDKLLATIIGLYHDIGRFEQDKRFDSFVDTKYFDHGDYGAKLLEEELITQIPIEGKYYNIITKAVKNHNKYTIEEGLTEQELLHAKLIRDADKLDIIDYMSKGKLRTKSFNYQDKSFDIRDEIKEEFFNKKQIYMKNKKNRTNSESSVKTLALVFDLNFKETAEYILDNHILEDFYNILLNKEKYKEYFNLATKHLKEMIKC